MRVAIVVFPGSNCDRDIFEAIKSISKKLPKFIWHKETNIENFDLIIIPGGFTFGDYLRCGALASNSPVIKIIPIMLLILTFLEIIGSLMLGYGVYYAFVNRSTLWIFYGFVVIAITIIILFAGQRIAKDYLGAADLVPYFILIMLGIMSMY